MGPFFQGGLPPLPSAGPNYTTVLINMAFAVVWSIVASIGFAAAISIGLKVLNLLTPGFNEWEEIKRGNLAVSILWGAFVIAVAIVVVGVLLK